MPLIIFDWKRTLYDPDSKSLIKGALNILNFLSRKNIPLVLIGKGGEDMFQEVKRLKVKKFFTDIVFCPGDKDASLFKKYVSKNSPRQTLVIGDRVRSEIEVGNILGITTIWVKQGKFAVEQPLNNNQRPARTVRSLIALKKLLPLYF